MKTSPDRRSFLHATAAAAAALCVAFSGAGCGTLVHPGPPGDGTLIQQRGGLWGVPLPYRLELRPVPLQSVGVHTLHIDEFRERDFSRPHLTIVVKSGSRPAPGVEERPVLRIRVLDSRGTTLVTRTIGVAPYAWEERGAGHRRELAQSIPEAAFPPVKAAGGGLTLAIEVRQPSSIPGSTLHITAY